MIRRYSWIVLFLIGTGRCWGQVRVALSTGYEQENFHWSIAGNSAGQDPTIYSELKWKSVGGIHAGVSICWDVWRRWRLWALGGRTFTHSGTMTDTDYGLNNRNDVLYHQQFPVTGGYSETGSLGVGYAVLDGRFSLTPFVGYGISKQYFPVRDPGGLYASLNSSYAGKWMGPFVCVNGDLSFGQWRVLGMIRYDQVVYRGEADWNLIADFAHPVSFRHRADGFGLTGSLGLSYGLGRHWVFSLKGDLFSWETGTGIDELYLTNGSTSQTQLNEVVRSGFGGGLGAAWTF